MRPAGAHPETLESTRELPVFHVCQAHGEHSLLLEAYHGRHARLGLKHQDTLESLKQLVTLYEAWLKPEEAAKWRAKLPPKETIEE